MRPQHDAAENAGFRRSYITQLKASMRPQHDAAENEICEIARAGVTPGFNEAAA